MKLIFIINILICFLQSIDCRTKRQIAFPEEEDVEVCRTPNGKSGVCEPLFRCDIVLNAKNIKLLKQSNCGFDNNVPKVCCPIAKQEIATTAKPKKIRTTPKIKIKTTTRTTTTTLPPFETISPIVADNEQEFEAIPKSLPKICGNTSVISKTRIVGGKQALPGSWPWVAAIFIEDSGQFAAQCGGALISDQHIITASHCVVDGGRVLSTNRLRVRLGEHNIAKRTKEDQEIDMDVMEVMAHPQFEPRTYKNDIAILKLSEKVKFNRRVWPICLPFDTQVLTSEENIGRSGFITGWGRLEFNGRTSDVLQEADVEIKSNNECNKAFERVVKITDQYLCAGSLGSKKDSCQGDSGGPLMQIDPENKKFYLTGVVSFGRRCATPGFPGVYARVSYFLNWISKNL